LHRNFARHVSADAHQTCLTHSVGDVTFALENSEDLLPMRLIVWLQKAFGLARDIEGRAVLAARRIAQLMPDQGGRACVI
jgi:transposase